MSQHRRLEHWFARTMERPTPAQRRLLDVLAIGGHGFHVVLPIGPSGWAVSRINAERRRVADPINPRTFWSCYSRGWVRPFGPHGYVITRAGRQAIKRMLHRRRRFKPWRSK